MIKIANYDVQHLVSEFDANKDRFYNSTVESDVKWSSLTLYGLDEQNSKTTATLQNNDQASWTTAASHFPETVKFLQQLDFSLLFCKSWIHRVKLKSIPTRAMGTSDISYTFSHHLDSNLKSMAIHRYLKTAIWWLLTRLYLTGRSIIPCCRGIRSCSTPLRNR